MIINFLKILFNKKRSKKAQIDPRIIILIIIIILLILYARTKEWI